MTREEAKHPTRFGIEIIVGSDDDELKLYKLIDKIFDEHEQEKEALQKRIDELEEANGKREKVICQIADMRDDMSALYDIACLRIKELEAQLEGKVVAEFEGEAKTVETKLDEEKIGVWADGIGAYSTYETGWPCLYRFKNGSKYIIRIIEKDKA